MVVALLSCAETGQPGAFHFDLYQTNVVCDADWDHCEKDGLVKQPLQLTGQAYVSRLASSFDTGVYVYLEFRYPQSEKRALLEFDIPDGKNAQPKLLYVEFNGDKETFRSTRAEGRVDPPTLGCPCTDGRFELRFSAAGADGRIGTADDQTRRLSRGQFSRGLTFCHAAKLTAITAGKLEQGVLACPRPGGPTSTPGRTYRDDYYNEYETGCGVEAPPPAVVYEDEGCGGTEPDGYDGGYDSYDDSDPGCDADTTDSNSAGCEGDSSDGGCESDGRDSSSDVGCGSDSSSGGESCDSAAHAASHRQKLRGRRGRLLPRFGVTLPFVVSALICFGLLDTRRRRRRRR